MERFGSAWSDSTGEEIDGNDVEINRLNRELKKKEAERQQLGVKDFASNSKSSIGKSVKAYHR